MPCPTPCAQCDRSGLPILFTRYAAAYHHDEQIHKKLQALTPKGKLQAQPGGIPLKTACYGVRMLRAGYLYVVIEREAACYPDDHMAYSVHPHGYLNAFEPTLNSQPAPPKVACDVETRAANNSMVFVRNAKTVKALWYVFHPDAMATDTWAEMRQKPAEHGMQRFDVKAWAKGKHEAEHSIKPDQLNKTVLEFAALEDAQLLQASDASLFGLMGMTGHERGWGSFASTVGDLMKENRSGKVSDDRVRAAANKDKQVGWAHNTTVTTIEYPSYAAVHGRRLANITKLLKDHQDAAGKPMPGAVLACLDTVGIAQELAMGQIEAAVLYAQWLQQTDAKGASNRMKEAAAAGIETMQAAIKAKAVKVVDQTVERLNETADRVSAGQFPGNMPGAVYGIRQADGSVKNVTQDELNRQRGQELRQTANQTKAGEAKALLEAVESVHVHVDLAELAKFKAEHKAALTKRDKAMSDLFEDLAPWLDAKAPWEPVFKRYTSAQPEIGAQCAGQLCVILMHVDNSPKGRAYLRARDVLMPGAQQLVWRMITLNNAEIAAEIKQALAILLKPIPGVLDAQADGQAAYAAAAFLAVFKDSKEFLADAESAREQLDKLKDASTSHADKRTALDELIRAGRANIGCLIAAFAVNHIKVWPATQLERRLAHAQLLTLVHGMGAKAVGFVQQSGQRVVGSPAKRARELQGRINHAAEKAATQAGKLRVAVAVSAFDSLGLAPALRRAVLRGDGRSKVEASQALLETAAAMKSLRSTVYEALLYKELPEGVGKTYQAGVRAVNARELTRLKKSAAYWVSAGTAIGVVIDAFDAGEAWGNGDKELALAYGGRSVLGLGTIGATIASAGFENVPFLLARINIALPVATAAISYAIVKIKGEAWANWLQKQPFHTGDSTKTPYTTERAQMLDLGEALAELKAE